MAGLARKIIICAAIDGLVIQPLSSKGQRPFQPIKLKYGDASISVISRDQVPDTSLDGSSFEAFGVIGLITVSKLSFLITITRRQQVAQIFGHPIYAVTGVAVTPCSSKESASDSIRKTANLLDSDSASAAEDTESSDEETDAPASASDEIEDTNTESAGTSRSARNSIAEDVFRKRGSYGKFAQRWFSRGAWNQDKNRTIGLSDSTSSLQSDGRATPQPDNHPGSAIDNETQSQTTSLLPKLLRSIQLLFGSSRSLYFSYDLDITRSLADTALSPSLDAPLYSKADSVFFWNHNILEPFMESRQDSVALPVMQGFVGQRSFIVDSNPPQMDEPKLESVEMNNLSPTKTEDALDNKSDNNRSSLEMRTTEKKYLITLISRRSTKRAGLRYLRRGIDENGFTANMVETEQLLSSSKWDAMSPIYSFLQIRGSIPLYWTQTAYALKPIPVVQHSPEENYKACKKHFERLRNTYGKLQVVNLVEKQGIEESIGTQFQNNVQRINEEGNHQPDIPFEWFDFHHACRGMKFENVNDLLLRLKDELEGMGSSVQQGSSLVKRQMGVFRTNCMDCLDRTNVCQSCFAKHMLDLQLKAEGIDMTAQVDQDTTWFNTLWADNGDAVSKQYASTAAMKGDYTRTKKRDYRGALNDLGLSLARLYSGMVNDYFSQAVIDFILGNVTGKVFEEFEADMMTKDPAISVTKMRERAVELCQKRVIADLQEETHGGWVLISPNVTDVVRSSIMEDVVLLLTDAALYLCRFDWDLDKVSSFERVNLGNINQIKYGTYITSTVSSVHADETKNVGLVVTYQPGKSDIRRTNTRTLSSMGDLTTAAASLGRQDATIETPSIASFFSIRPKVSTTRKLAFKAPYTDSSTAVARSGPQQTELQQVVTICNEIDHLIQEQQLRKEGEEAVSIVEKGDIISLEAAKRNTGLLEQLGHSIKRLVWA